MEDIHEKLYYHLRLTPDPIPDMTGVITQDLSYSCGAHHFQPYLEWIQQISPDEHLAVVEILNDEKEYHPHIHSIIYVSKYHNHSATPNCANVLKGDKRHLVALKDIGPDEEITVDYTLQSDLEQPGDDWL